MQNLHKKQQQSLSHPNLDLDQYQMHLENEILNKKIELSIKETTPANKRHLLNQLIKKAKHKAMLILQEREMANINVTGSQRQH